jgi:hypothetical protein
VRLPADLHQDSGFPIYHYLRFVEEGDRPEATMIRMADPEGTGPLWEEKDLFEIPATQPSSK